MHFAEEVNQLVLVTKKEEPTAFGGGRSWHIRAAVSDATGNRWDCEASPCCLVESSREEVAVEILGGRGYHER